MPKKFRSGHFLNIETIRPTDRRETTLRYLRNNCIMPEINEVIKIHEDKSRLLEQTNNEN
jgi:hypothetical protein